MGILRKQNPVFQAYPCGDSQHHLLLHYLTFILTKAFLRLCEEAAQWLHADLTLLAARSSGQDLRPWERKKESILFITITYVV